MDWFYSIQETDKDWQQVDKDNGVKNKPVIISIHLTSILYLFTYRQNCYNSKIRKGGIHEACSEISIDKENDYTKLRTNDQLDW